MSILPRCLRLPGAVLALLVAASALHAAPADDYQRGLKAYQRGDVVGAMTALRPAASAGHAKAQALLAFVLEGADEVAEAARLYRAAAAQDDVDGHFGLARLLLVGRGVAKDEKLALEHFSKAAALGSTSALETLATAYLKGLHGADAQADPAGARAAVMRAAESGHLPSAEALALAYGDGRFGLTPDAAEAARWRARAEAWKRERAAASAPARGKK